MEHVRSIEARLAGLRVELLQHPIYTHMNRLDVLQRFMQFHVFAVWDFMSLLKALQRRLCCVAVPWTPAADPALCRFLNEIVLAEESDADGRGGYSSHFELYRRAMRECGADTSSVDALLEELRRGASLSAALEAAQAPAAAARFVRHTFQIIESGNLSAIASAFTFGREDLLPDVFQRIVDGLNRDSGGKLATFQYYLERHIGLDGDEHGPLALRLVESLCGEDETRWAIAEQAAVETLHARRELWDGVLAAIGNG